MPLSPHPLSTHLLLLLVPRWWRHVGVVALGCLAPASHVHPFAHAAFPADDFETSLPQAVFTPGTRLDAYLPSDATDSPVLQTTPACPARDLQPGSLLVLQPEGLPPPAMRDSGVHLHSLPHVRAADFPDGHIQQAHPCDVALLGVGFELRLGGAPILTLVARLLDMPEADVFLHHQPTAFPDLTIAGTPVSTCFGVRSKAIVGAEPAGRGVFIDSRSLGRPVPYRSIQAHRLCPSDICAMLDVPVPTNYQAFCEGGVDCPSYPGYFLIDHGMNLLVWLDISLPAATPAAGSDASSTPVDTDDEMADGSASLAREPTRARSRSPRRLPSGSHGCSGHAHCTR